MELSERAHCRHQNPRCHPAAARSTQHRTLHQTVHPNRRMKRMKQMTNRIGRNFGRFAWVETTYNDREREKKIKRNIDVYKWQKGALTFAIDDRTAFVLPDGVLKDLNRLKDVDGK